ncbi:MAG TPA: GC-type dockerin domain-anchored protein [Phycisphaerales bacterium]|nr:GC-type dockerin domain-anchored protein [Phycisphaerales bacterium]
MHAKRMLAAAGLGAAGIAVPALAQPVVDGQKDGAYGGAIALQTTGTGFGDSGHGDCDAFDVGNPAGVLTGIEIAIPLAELGNPAGAIRVFAAINGGGHDYLSNQVLGGLQLGTPNLGEPRVTDFGAFPGTQHAQFTPAAGAEPVIDGVRDASYTRYALQTNQTGFGDNDDSSVELANGSELDALYAVKAGGFLYVFLAGNLQTNFNKLDVFFDTESGGQNQLRGDNPDVDFNGLNRMGDDGSGNGMKFDTGFSADYWFSCTNGGDPTTIYANWASLNFGYGDYLGSTAPGSDGDLQGGNNIYGIFCTIDNSNVEGVPGYCKPAGTEDYANGSELDGLYGLVDTGTNRLYLLFTGNLENGTGGKDSNSGNKLTVLIDAQSGGQNRLRGDNVDISFGNLNRMGDDGSGNGFTNDTGFAPDYWMSVKTNNFPVYQVLDSAVLRTNGALRDFSGNALDYGAYDGNFKSEGVPVPYDGPLVQIQDGFTPNIYANYGPRLTQLDPDNPVPGLISLHIDNSNTAGVTDSSASGAGAVTTGIEISIDLDELGWDGASDIKVVGFISSEDAAYLSNQFLPGLPAGTPNVGDDGPTNTIDMADYAGQQWAVIPVGGNCDGSDCDGNGVIDTRDVICFLNQWNARDPDSDCDGNGVVDTRDVICFLNLWNACR